MAEAQDALAALNSSESVSTEMQEERRQTESEEGAEERPCMY